MGGLMIHTNLACLNSQNRLNLNRKFNYLNCLIILSFYLIIIFMKVKSLEIFVSFSLLLVWNQSHDLKLFVIIQ